VHRGQDRVDVEPGAAVGRVDVGDYVRLVRVPERLAACESGGRMR
jgi:hypothetical protein